VEVPFRTTNMSLRIGALTITACLVAARVSAQTDLVLTPPPNLIIANYNTAPVGPYGGLEGTAYAARIDDPSAAWFNPAGLARQAAPQISGSAGVYQRTLVVPRALPDGGSSIQQLPSVVGFTFVPHEGVTAGAALLTTNAWNQETDSELFSPVASGQQRFAYSAESGFTQRVAAVGVGYHKSGPWRIGGGLAFTLMDVQLAASASDRIADTSGLRSLLVGARASGTAIQMRAQGGAQYDIGNWRLGGAIRTPGATIHRTGSVTLDGVLASNPGSAGASLFDTDAALEFHLPWEFQGGIAFAAPRFEIEVDLQGYTPISPYPLLSSDQPVLLYSDAGAGTAPVVTSHPFAGLTSASKGIVNVAAGGHFRVLKDRDLRLHAGIGSNRSPVAPEDVVFSQVDLVAWSAGVSGTFGKFQFAVGWNDQRGTANDVTLRNLLNGDVVHSPIDVHVGGFIYSLAYQF
jgi:hypothetical protein